MQWPKCPSCHAPMPADTSSWMFIGTAWRPAYLAPCSCGASMSVRVPPLDWDGIIEQEALERFEPGLLRRRARNADIDETIVQEYVGANYRRLGFTAIEGPFKHGPDFKVMLDGTWQFAEVENEWRAYLKHEHHSKWPHGKCRILILLSPRRPRDDVLTKLPGAIIYIPLDHFVGWVASSIRSDPSAAKRWTERPTRRAKTELLVSEFERRFLGAGFDRRNATGFAKWIAGDIADRARTQRIDFKLAEFSADDLDGRCQREVEIHNQLHAHLYGPSP